LLIVLHRKFGGKYQLITRYSNDCWVITSAPRGEKDMSGLEILDAPASTDIDIVIKHHRHRIDSFRLTPLPFSDLTLLADLHQHEQERVEAMVNKRLARYATANRSRWKCTLAGTIVIILDFYRNFSKNYPQERRDLARRQELEAGLMPQEENVAISVI
jgi:hypothetical protein